MSAPERIQGLTSQLYGSENGAEITRRIQALVDEYRGRLPQHEARDLSERDAVLITYPDQVSDAADSPLSVLADFAEKHVRGLISTIHVLPFYPWSSDDGFSVMDFRAVAAQQGTWHDVRRLGRQFELMLDAEINHASAQGAWFHHFLKGRTPYRDYFIQVDDKPDLSRVVRPRTTPLVTHFRSEGRDAAVWTTFSGDQVDLNYRSPALLLEMLDVLLFYASQGAAFIRLDAVAFLWKEIGSTCINLPQTHVLVQLMRAVLDQVAPYVRLITETNVPQPDSHAYFGDGTNEAQLIYSFSLPPLVLHSFQTARAETLGRWISELRLPSEQATLLNVLATHDGIGLNPLRGILADLEIREMVQQCITRGGFVSSKMDPEGTSSPYEMNINYFDALDALGPAVDPGLEMERFTTAHAIMLSLIGVPAIYFHSLFGSRGWPQGVLRTGRNRSINREKLKRDRLEAELTDPRSVRARVFRHLGRLLAARAGCGAFSPHAGQRVLPSQGPILALIRGETGALPRVLCLYNVSPENCQFRVDDPDLASEIPANPRDLITGVRRTGGTDRSIRLKPYQSAWLSLDNPE
jgi:glycosidase